MKLTQLDHNQIVKQAYDEEANANRVYLVNGLNLDTKAISDSLVNAIGNIEFAGRTNPNTFVTNTTEYKTLEIPTTVIVKEPQIIYVDRPVVETKFVEVEKPVMVETVKFIEIEKQIVVREQQIVEIKIPEIIKQYDNNESKFIKLAFVILMGISLLTNLFLIIKK